jgi:hypothetical protein
VSRALVLALVSVLGLVAGVTLASCGGDDEATSTATTETEATTTETTGQEEPTVVRVTVTGGVPADGIVRETVSEGDRVVLVVTSDVADEIHLHGYDLSRDVPAGGEARVAFQATIPGRFEVELEQRGVQIAELTVEP